MYLKPNISIPSTIEVIKNKIKTSTPFCLSRFGDGEISILLQNQNKHINEKKICENWGYQYPNELKLFYQDSIPILIKSLKNSDIIGIMDPNTPMLPPGYYREDTWSLKKEFINFLGIDSSTLTICDHMIARSPELGDINNFKNIIQGEDLHIISSNKKQLEEKNLSKILECNVTITNHPYDINFNNRDSILNSFKHIKSNIVITGTSLNKDYGVILKNNYNKIVIDLGATLDAWAGKISRPWFNNKQSYLVV
jgi:hypothetical protein